MKSRMAAIAAACTFAMAMGVGPALAYSANSANNQGQNASNGKSWGHGHGNHQPSPVTEVASQLISPLKVAFGPKGSFLVAESFAGRLTSISSTGVKTNVVSAPGQEIAGVSYRNGTTYYFNNDQGSGPEPGGQLLPARLMQINHRGEQRQLADLSVFEAANNPDGTTVYGD